MHGGAAGRETGVKAVELVEGDAVWKAGEQGRWSKELLSSALSRSDTPLGLTPSRRADPGPGLGSGVIQKLVAESRRHTSSSIVTG